MGLQKLTISSRLISITAVGIAGIVGSFIMMPSAHAQVAYAISNFGSSLVSFDITNPNAILSTVTLNIGGSTTTTVNGQPVFVGLDGIDFRPSNGLLYGYSDTTDTLYTVNTATGSLTALPGTVSGSTNSNFLGIDFNPVVDRLRLVNDATENLVFVPTSSTPVSTTPTLSYASTDPGFNSPFGPQVVEAGYTNNFAGATATTLYGIDYGTSSLVTINVTTGAVTTVGNTLGNLGITLPTPANGTPFVGFDIFTTAAGVNTAYAVLDTTTGTSSGTAPSLYTINLATGQASSVGRINGSGVYSLAITPNAAAPEPGSIALALMGGGALTGRIVVRRRRKTA